METVTIEVDGYKYDFQSFGALEAVQNLGRVNAILGVGLKTVGDAEGGPALLVSILGGLMSNLGDDRVIDLIKRFASRTTLHCEFGPMALSDNNFENFNQHFDKRIVALGKWFAECFKFQYADFLDYARDTVLLRLVALEQLVLKSLAMSIGSSGESSPAQESPTAS